MSLIEMQKLLANLYTSEHLREQFRQNPETTGAHYGLSPEASRQLCSVNWTAVDRFARSLINKRLKLVKPFLPATCILLGNELLSLFSIYCERFPLVKRLQAPEEAQQFACFLNQQSNLFIKNKASYAKDTLSFEQTRLEVMVNAVGLDTPCPVEPLHVLLDRDDWLSLYPMIAPQLRVEQFAYPVDELIPKIIAGENVGQTPESVRILFIYNQQSNAIQTRRIKVSTQRLLSLSHGHFTIKNILDTLRNELDISEVQYVLFEDECRCFYDRLVQEKMIHFV